MICDPPPIVRVGFTVIVTVSTPVAVTESVAVIVSIHEVAVEPFPAVAEIVTMPELGSMVTPSPVGEIAKVFVPVPYRAPNAVDVSRVP